MSRKSIIPEIEELNRPLHKALGEIREQPAPEIIHDAVALLQPINFNPPVVAYFVVKNRHDMGGEDYCKDCIGGAVKKAREHHYKRRSDILDRFEQIEQTGFIRQGRKKIQVKGKYTDKQIRASKRHELKLYPARVSFNYTGHDPDFAGGLHEPCSCADCGQYFQCQFTPDKELAKHLLHMVNQLPAKLEDRDKWAIDIALRNYPYVKEEVKPILERVAKRITKNHVTQGNGKSIR